MFFNHIEFTKKIEKSLQLTNMKHLSKGSAVTLFVQEHIKCSVTSYFGNVWCGDDFNYAYIVKVEPREWLKFLKLNNKTIQRVVII
jgi:hypothetical protein